MKQHWFNLVTMKPGTRGVITHIEGGMGLERRLNSMGLVKGKHITKLSAFVLRGPVAVRVGRTVLALGHGMAKKIWVHPETT